jgi:Retrotransposon gag protein
MSATYQYTTRSVTRQFPSQNNSSTIGCSRPGNHLRAGSGRGRGNIQQTPTPPSRTPNPSANRGGPSGGSPPPPPIGNPDLPDIDNGPDDPDGPPPGPPPDDDNEPPDPDDEPPDPDPEPNNPMADAMRLLAQTITSTREPSKTKVREPDVFDGSNPKKLRTYLVQCQINFRDRPSAFYSESSKINFAISYLSGTALSWFEPVLLGKITPIPMWYYDYELFVHELEKNFGPYDPEADAEIALENLVMRENQHITKYSTEFYRLAAEVQWDDASLRRRYYKNLPTCIKNEISRVGKPKTLHQMRDLAQSIDQRYWEREEEIRQEISHKKGNPSNSNNGNSSTNSGKTPEKKKQKFFAPSNSGNFSTPSTSTNKNSGSSKPTLTPEYANKLGKDGKLTPEERNRRLMNKLCLFCAQPGHNAINCPKSSSNASRAKARSANIDPSPDISSDSKK